MFASRRRLLAALVYVLVLHRRSPWGRGFRGIYPAGTSGIDISYPACADELPAAPMSFAIIGVNGGGPSFTTAKFKEFAGRNAPQRAGFFSALFL